MRGFVSEITCKSLKSRASRTHSRRMPHKGRMWHLNVALECGTQFREEPQDEPKTISGGIHTCPRKSRQTIGNFSSARRCAGFSERNSYSRKPHIRTGAQSLALVGRAYALLGYF